jgi:uroporphyrinogen-III decarboxylase
MSGSHERIMKALNHRKADRTPLFEIFQPYHPIHWPVCGRNVGTDAAMAWDAKADGISWEEVVEAEAQAAFKIAKFFGLDMVRLNGCSTVKNYVRPARLSKNRWKLDNAEFALNERTKMVELANPEDKDSWSHRTNEDELKKTILNYAESCEKKFVYEANPVYKRVRELAEKEGLDWVFMAEIGAGTGAAFYPPFMLMWMIDEVELYLRWLEIQKRKAFWRTLKLIEDGHAVVAMGGDVSCDKGPFISPDMYHEFILPVIKEHVEVIHKNGARAVYTSDGNHWPIKDDFFFNSGTDGYKEVDKAAGMTMEKLIGEGVASKICIIGNIDARHVLCHGTKSEVETEVTNCLKLGLQCQGGHILHNSHSVHEDVKAENYLATVNTYREFFGMGKISW